MRIFISRMSALGDVVCTTPVAVAARKQWPDAEIVWAVDKRFAPILECCPSVSRIVVWPKELRLMREAARDLGKFDLALDMQGLLKSSVAVGLVKADRKLGYHWQREGSWLFSQKVLPDSSSLHVVDQYVDVVRAAGADADRAEFDLAPRPEDTSKMHSMLVEAGWDREAPLVIAHAGAGWATKRWPPPDFAALCRHLLSRGAFVAFMGTRADRPAFQDVLGGRPGEVADLLERTSVRELPALLSQASLHVAGDTGSIHIAAALGIPCLGLYTVTRPDRSCPYGQCTTSRPFRQEEACRVADELLDRAAT